MSIRIAIAEDQRLIRELLVGILTRESGFEIVAQAGTGQEAIALADSARPDILLLDVTLPDVEGMEVARAVRKAQPKLGILVLSIHEEPHVVRAMLQAGADGYVVKSGTVGELVQAVRAVHQGRMYLSPSITRQAVARDAGLLAGVAQLSAREREVLGLLANGHQSRVIALKLGITKGTVEVHRRNIMTKLGLHTIAELTKYAVREGLTSS
jgi:DNA-binding NarL/FixJ family response regulator